MYRELCNLHVLRTACYACIQCALRITRTSRIHHSRSTARMACTARRQLTDIGCACIARTACRAYAQVEIFPHLQDPIYTQHPTQHSSHTALPDEHCSGRKHLHCRTQPIHTGTARSTRNACTRCGQWDSRRNQGDITDLFDLHSKRSTSANCGMKL